MERTISRSTILKSYYENLKKKKAKELNNNDNTNNKAIMVDQKVYVMKKKTNM